MKSESHLVKREEIQVKKAPIKNFRDLQIWRLGNQIVLDVYKVTRAFPKEELYGLISQTRRAAVSIPANIAEGFNRFHNKEYKQFLFIALGSCAEAETLISLAVCLNYLSKKESAGVEELIDHEQRMIRNLIKKL